MGFHPGANVAPERRVAIPTTSVTLANDCGGEQWGGNHVVGTASNPFILFHRRWRRYSIGLVEPYIGYPTMYASVVIGLSETKLRKKTGAFVSKIIVRPKSLSSIGFFRFASATIDIRRDVASFWGRGRGSGGVVTRYLTFLSLAWRRILHPFHWP